jgi:predicted alpha/beta-fold hydrolase
MNMRNCGDTDELTPTLYHSGLSADVGAVMHHYAEQFGLERVALIGYSMGGNLVLKLAGEWGSAPPLCAVATVCPAIDLAAGSDALHEPVNRLYERHFLRGLMRRYRRKAAFFPQIFEMKGVDSIRSLREFDDTIVARHCGFRDADDYYYRAASARVVDKISVPALIIRAEDDPFVRLVPETRAALHANPNVLLVETRHGGHCAYLSRDRGRYPLGRSQRYPLRDAVCAGRPNRRIQWKLIGSSRLGMMRPSSRHTGRDSSICVPIRTELANSQKRGSHRALRMRWCD